MKILKAEELAELKGVTKRAVYKNKSLPYTQDDGGARQYDLNNSEIQAWLNGKKKVQKKAENKKPSKGTAKKNTDKKPTAKPKQIKPPKKSKDKDIPNEIIKLVDSGQLTLTQALNMNKTDLEKIKLYETIKKTKIEAEIKRNDYISKKLVEVVLHKTYQIDRAQLIPLKDRLVIDLSEIFKVEDDKLKVKAAEKIDSELFDYLESVKKIMNDFLNEHKGDEII